MVDVEASGWRKEWVGELDHRILKVPSVKLRAARELPGGDVAWCIDLRVRPPNADAYMTSTELHSLEHFLLEGLQRLLPEHFISIGIMGCQTGFYIILGNEGRAERICAVLEQIFTEMQDAAAVPYARIDQCGNWRNHSLEAAQAVAREILAGRKDWLVAA